MLVGLKAIERTANSNDDPQCTTLNSATGLFTMLCQYDTVIPRKEQLDITSFRDNFDAGPKHPVGLNIEVWSVTYRQAPKYTRLVDYNDIWYHDVDVSNVPNRDHAVVTRHDAHASSKAYQVAI